MKRLFRDRWNKKIGGVCGGLGVYFGIDPTIFRLCFLFLALSVFVLPSTLFAIFAYVLLWIFLPPGPKVFIDTGAKKLYRSKRNRLFAGVCGGIGEYFNLDPIFFRVVLLIFTFLSFGTMCILYFSAIYIIPEK